MASMWRQQQPVLPMHLPNLTQVYGIDHDNIDGGRNTEQGLRSFAFAFPRTEFEEPARRFNDFKGRSIYGPLVEALGALDAKYIGGTQYKENDVVFPYHCGAHAYKFDLAIEVLLKEMPAENDEWNDKMIWGYRFWIHVFDRSVKLATIFSAYAKSKATNKTCFLREIVTDHDMQRHVFMPLVQHVSGHISANDVRPLNVDNLDVQPVQDFSILYQDPANILDRKNAFVPALLMGVCEEQAHISNYSTSENTARPRFPYPHLTFRIAPEWAGKISRLPLPSMQIIKLHEAERVIREETIATHIIDTQIKGTNNIDDKDKLSRMLIEKFDIIVKAKETAEQLTESIVTLGISDAEEYREDRFRNYSEHVDVIRIGQRLNAEIAAFKRTVSVEDDMYAKGLHELRKKGIGELRQMVMESTKVSTATIYVREMIVDQKPADIMECLTYYTELTSFGNLVAHVMFIFDHIMGMNTNFKIMMEALIMGLGVYRFTFDMVINMFVTGEAEAGKSYMMELLKTILLPGVADFVSHETAKARTTSTNVYNRGVLRDEMPFDMFGITKEGKKVDSDPIAKTLLTKREVETFEFFRDPLTGKRISKRVACMQQIFQFIATNTIIPEDTNAMMTRFLHEITARQVRAEGEFRKYNGNDQTIVTLREHAIKYFHQIQKYMLLIETAIAMGIFPDVDRTLFNQVTSSIFAVFKTRGIPSPSKRTVERLWCAVRTMTLFHGSHMEYFSEIGLANRSNPDGSARPFSFSDLPKCIKWFCPTLEIIIFCLTLMENSFVNTYEKELSRVCAILLKWPPRGDLDEKRFMDATTNGRATRNWNYIQITDSELTTLAGRIRNKMNPAPSDEDVRGLITNLKNKSLVVPVYCCEFAEENRKALNECCVCKNELPTSNNQRKACDFCKGYRCENCDGRCCFSPPPPAARDNNQAPLIVRCVACNRIFSGAVRDCPRCKLPCHNKCLKVCAGSECKHKSCPRCLRPCAKCKEKFHYACLETHRDYMPVANENGVVETQEMACSIEDYTPQPRKKRLCILTDFLRTTNTSLEECIREAVEHRHLTPFTCMTGFSYVDPQPKPEYMSGPIYYQYFRTIKLTPRPERNQYHIKTSSTGEFAKMARCMTWDRKLVVPIVAGPPISVFNKDPADHYLHEFAIREGLYGPDVPYSVIKDGNYEVYMEYVHRNGGTVLETPFITIPKITTRQVWFLRDNVKYFAAERQTKNSQAYPEACVADVKLDCYKKWRVKYRGAFSDQFPERQSRNDETSGADSNMEITNLHDIEQEGGVDILQPDMVSSFRKKFKRELDIFEAPVLTRLNNVVADPKDPIRPNDIAYFCLNH